MMVDGPEVRLTNGNPWFSRLLSIVRIAAGLVFFQHGAEKLWGFAGARVTGLHLTLRGAAGPIEVLGGSLLVLGLFTRTTAFILCGEMAVAYFTWVRNGIWPINNGGEEAVLFCFLYLWLVTAGPGPWSVDSLIQGIRAGGRKPAGLVLTLDSWEGYGRALLRIIVAFTFSLHGFRHLFGAFPQLAGRRGAVPIAMDVLPPWFGVLEIGGSVLLIAGLFTSVAGFIVCAELLASYVYAAAPRSVWPIQNGGNDVILYFLIFLYLAVSGAGRWSLDDYRRRVKSGFAPRPATE
jgi:putative oxidoreductase